MSTNRRVGWGAFPRALWAALQWRVMLIWIVLMAIPTLIAALPVSRALGALLDHSFDHRVDAFGARRVSRALGALLDHSVESTAMAQKFHGLLMSDTLFQLGQHNAAVIGGSVTVGLIVTLILSPFLTGVVVTAVQAPRHPTLGELMHGGLAQYWRMVRLMLWSLVPYIIAIIIGSIAWGVASANAQTAITQSSADAGYHAALIILIVVLVLAHAIMESSRAQIAADPALRSATRAFGHGISMLARRPLATLGLYVGTSVVGYVLAGLAGMWRIRVDAVGLGGFVAALALTQLIVLILAWQRTARIDALARVARATPFGGRRGTVALAPA